MKYQGKRDALSPFVQFTIRLTYLNRHTVLKMQSFSDKDSTFALDLFKSLHSRNIISRSRGQILF